MQNRQCSSSPSSLCPALLCTAPYMATLLSSRVFQPKASIHSFTETSLTHIQHPAMMGCVFSNSEEGEEEEPRSSSWTLLHAFTEFHGAPQVKRRPSYCERKLLPSPMSDTMIANLCLIKKNLIWTCIHINTVHPSLPQGEFMKWGQIPFICSEKSLKDE